MRLRTSPQFQDRASNLIREHNLGVSSTVVVASWFNPIPMVLHRSSRMTELGDFSLALVLIFFARFIQFGLIFDDAVALASSFLFSWFAFRVYYDFRFGGSERMILMPPTAGDEALLHELLHVHLGHINRMSVVHRLLAISPLGPLEYGIRALQHDYGGEGVVGELHERTKAKLHSFLFLPGLVTFAATAYVLFFLLILFEFG